ncbi:LemA family protein [Caulobacter sp. X]|uniref:LemA family protein n=1 Tax=Caulobacter sp. X TaxID=2048901 RepID=UPI000C146F8C|nr:LemA family protein [Caulobacter sp. X]PIC01466.1 LemA family protein [Caulobacter sp. X]
MANELDEITGPVDPAGRDINVVAKQIPVTIGVGSLIFEIALWAAIPVLALSGVGLGLIPPQNGLLMAVLGVLPGVIFQFMKINALAYLRKLQQRVQADASQIDNYLEQRVVILNNVVGLLNKAVDLDKDVMKSVAAMRSGAGAQADVERNMASAELNNVLSRINVAFEAYPDLKAHAAIADAMQQNSYLQKEITAARTLYNDTVAIWNQDIFAWPAKQIVAARKGYTTRIPFIATAEIKAAAREAFF